MVLDCTTCFHLSLYFFLLTVYCYALIYQGKFLVCENLLGNKPDSDSDYDFLMVSMNRRNDYSKQKQFQFSDTL